MSRPLLEKGIEEFDPSYYSNDLGQSRTTPCVTSPDSDNASMESNEPVAMADFQTLRARPGAMSEISAKMVETIHQIAIANAQKVAATTKISAPGKDSVSALAARFFNARGLVYHVHTDRGADIGEQLAEGLKDAASSYTLSDEDNEIKFRSV